MEGPILRTARVCGWQVLCGYVNDCTFNPVSTGTVYRQLHEDYADPVDLSYDVMKKFGILTPGKAKDKFTEMRAKLVIIKSDHEASGQGEGGLPPGTRDGRMTYESDDDLDAVGGAFDDRQNFLRGQSPVLLYFWQKMDEFDKFPAVMQQLELEVNEGSCRKRKRKENTDVDEVIAKQLKASTEAIQNYNVEMMKDKLEELEDKVDAATEKLEELEEEGHMEGSMKWQRQKRKVDVLLKRCQERKEGYEKYLESTKK